MLLLDSDILVDVLRRYPPAIAWLNSRVDQVAVPGYVAMELFQGCRNKSEQQNALQRRIDVVDAATARPSLRALTESCIACMI